MVLSFRRDTCIAVAIMNYYENKCNMRFCLLLTFFMTQCNAVWLLTTEEPQCSRYHYEKQLLSKMIRTEIKFEELQQQVQTHLKETTKKLLSFQKTMDIINTDMATNMSNFTKTVEETNNETLEDIKLSFQKFKADLDEVSYRQDFEKIPNIAFSSRTLRERSLEKGQIYIFMDTVYNFGEGYDNTTGIFTTPVDGMYLFTTSMCAEDSNANAYAIVTKNVDVARSVMQGGKGRPCNSLSAVLSLNISDTVFVRSTWSGTHAHEDTSNRWSTFYGLLVHK